MRVALGNQFHLCMAKQRSSKVSQIDINCELNTVGQLKLQKKKRRREDPPDAMSLLRQSTALMARKSRRTKAPAMVMMSVLVIGKCPLIGK